MAAATAKTFSTRPFRMAHGKEPRGFGTWAFFPAADYGTWDGDALDPRVQWVNASYYADAKKALPAGNWVVLS